MMGGLRRQVRNRALGSWMLKTAKINTSNVQVFRQKGCEAHSTVGSCKVNFLEGRYLTELSGRCPCPQPGPNEVRAVCQPSHSRPAWANLGAKLFQCGRVFGTKVPGTSGL